MRGRRAIPEEVSAPRLRQSEIGFETFGPTVAGAKTSGFAARSGRWFPAVPNGINSGLMRLRTATMRMDWTNTSVVAGQDDFLFAEFADIVCHAGDSRSLLCGKPVGLGAADTGRAQSGVGRRLKLAISGRHSGPGNWRNSRRVHGLNLLPAAGPGEESRQPAYATRIAWTHNLYGQPLRLGAAAYYSRQDYGFNRNVDGWAGMTDVELPLNRQFSLSGKFYRGRLWADCMAALDEACCTAAIRTPGHRSASIRLNWRLGATEIPAGK
jgi:hypothetical protein